MGAYGGCQKSILRLISACEAYDMGNSHYAAEAAMGYMCVCVCIYICTYVSTCILLYNIHTD